MSSNMLGSTEGGATANRPRRIAIVGVHSPMAQAGRRVRAAAVRDATEAVQRAGRELQNARAAQGNRQIRSRITGKDSPEANAADAIRYLKMAASFSPKPPPPSTTTTTTSHTIATTTTTTTATSTTKASDSSTATTSPARRRIRLIGRWALVAEATQRGEHALSHALAEANNLEDEISR